MMNKINVKFKKFPAIVLLTGYILFLVIAAIHFHHYNLNYNNYSLTESRANTENSSDLGHGFLGICSIHHFYTSVLKLCCTPENLISAEKKPDSIIMPVNLKPRFQSISNEISPRAPPAYS